MSLTGPALALASGIVWGASDFLGGMASKRASALHVVVLSQVAGLVLVGAAALVTGAYDAPAGYLPWSLLASVAGSTALVAFYAALASGTMGVVSPIASLGVLGPVLVGVLGHGDRPSTSQVAGIVLAIVGVALAGGYEFSARGKAKPIILAVVSAVGFGVALVGIGEGAQHSSLMTVVAMRVFSVAILGVVMLRMGMRLRPRGRDLTLTVVAGAGDASANLLFSVASTLGMLSITGVLGSLYPVATVLLARVVLGERLGRLQQFAVVAALIGVALIGAG